MEIKYNRIIFPIALCGFLRVLFINQNILKYGVQGILFVPELWEVECDGLRVSSAIDPVVENNGVDGRINEVESSRNSVTLKLVFVLTERKVYIEWIACSYVLGYLYTPSGLNIKQEVIFVVH